MLDLRLFRFKNIGESQNIHQFLRTITSPLIMSTTRETKITLNEGNNGEEWKGSWSMEVWFCRGRKESKKSTSFRARNRQKRRKRKKLGGMLTTDESSNRNETERDPPPALFFLFPSLSMQPFFSVCRPRSLFHSRRSSLVNFPLLAPLARTFVTMGPFTCKCLLQTDISSSLFQHWYQRSVSRLLFFSLLVLLFCLFPNARLVSLTKASVIK